MHTRTLSSAEIYRRLLSHVRVHARVFLLSILAMVALASTEWVLPALLKHLVDEEFGHDMGEWSLLIPVALVALFFGRGFLSYGSTVGLNWVANQIVTDLRTVMFRSLVALPARFFDDHSSGELISKFTFDVTQVSQAATRVLTVLVKDSVVIIALLGYLFYLNWHLAIYLMILAPFVGYVVSFVSKRMRELSRRLQTSMGAINQVTEEAIGGHREIKIYAAQDYETRRFDQASNDARKFQNKVVGTSAATEPAIQLLIAVGIGVMIVLALRESAQGLMTRGDFVSFVTATALLLPPVKRLTSVNEYLQRGLAAAESIFALVDEPGETDPGTLTLAPMRGEIEFRGVSIAYTDTPVLREVDLHIKPGESVAFVGPSGGGKTSLVNAVPRFYEIRSGELLIDGQPLADITLASLRAGIAYVGQDIVLFNDTVYNNIAYGALRSVTPAQVQAAAAAAHVTDFVNAMPQGFETLIGENGVRLSGGQRQRLAIARALLKAAPILILDEATSALDAESERRIQAALAAVRQGRTCLIVAHRLSTIEGVDRIVVLDRGRIVETGTHRELLTTGGVYAKLYATQREVQDKVVNIAQAAG